MNMAIIGGAGLLGSTTAFTAGMQGLFDEIFLIGRRENMVMNHVMDMDQALYPLSKTRIRAGNYTNIADSDVLFVTASKPERKVENRNEYLYDNLELMADIAENIGKYGKGQVILFATNPIDVFNYAFYQKLGWPRERFLGFSYNDTLRLRWALADELHLPYEDIEAFVLGEHGDGQVPVFEHITCAGRALEVDQATRTRVQQRIVTFFRDIQSLESGRTSGWTSAVSMTKILHAIATESDEIIPCSAVLDGEYGEHGVSMGVPVRLGKGGVREIIEFALQPETCAKLAQAAKGIRSLYHAAFQ